MTTDSKRTHRVYTCSLCGTAGHNRRSCAKVSQAAPRASEAFPSKKIKIEGVPPAGMSFLGKPFPSKKIKIENEPCPKEAEAAPSKVGAEGDRFSPVAWLDVNPRRGASPCVLKRKFGYILSHHKHLADCEKQLRGLRAKLAKKRTLNRTDKRHLSDAEARVESRKKRLSFSIETMENALRYAMARISPDSPDGKLLREKRPRNYSPSFISENLRAEIKYYADIMDEWKLAKAAAAGHSGSNAALQALIEHSSKTLSYWKSRSGRETDDANQGAIIGLLEAAREFDPCHGKFARFTTFAGTRVRRRSQVRAARDCRPGTTLVTDPTTKKRKQVTRGVLDVDDGSDDHADRFHPTAKHTDVSVTMDVRRVLDGLDPEDAEIARLKFECGETIKKIAESYGTTTGIMRRRINEIRARLASRLSAYSCAS